MSRVHAAAADACLRRQARVLVRCTPTQVPEFLSFGFIFNFNKKLVTQIFKASLYIYMYLFKPTSKRTI